MAYGRDFRESIGASIFFGPNHWMRAFFSGCLQGTKKSWDFFFVRFCKDGCVQIFALQRLQLESLVDS